MGLAGPRNRRKIQFDPNNTKWSRDETTFGQRILRAQGWEPGKFLGAQNAAHAHLHTAASAAPINVLMKDDTLGLGAKPKHKQNAECTGLDVFKDLLGRLNGKTEEKIEQERQVRSNIKTNLYVERKYGLMRFVSGGLLVGDQMEDLKSTTIKTPSSESSDDGGSASTPEDATTSPAKKQKKEKKSKKRKAEDSDSVDLRAIPEKKRKKQSKDETSQAESTGIPKTEDPSRRKEKSKKSKRKDTDNLEPVESEKKEKKKRKSKNSEHDVESDNPLTASEEAAIDKTKSKEKRKDKSKKEKKEKRQKTSDTTESSTDIPTPTPGVTLQESGASTPTGSGTSTPQAFSARHYARSRNIASKRMAMADMQALNQIFMVKPVS